MAGWLLGPPVSTDLSFDTPDAPASLWQGSGWRPWSVNGRHGYLIRDKATGVIGLVQAAPAGQAGIVIASYPAYDRSPRDNRAVASP